MSSGVQWNWTNDDVSRLKLFLRMKSMCWLIGWREFMMREFQSQSFESWRLLIYVVLNGEHKGQSKLPDCEITIFSTSLADIFIRFTALLAGFPSLEPLFFILNLCFRFKRAQIWNGPMSILWARCLSNPAVNAWVLKNSVGKSKSWPTMQHLPNKINSVE